MNLRRLNFKVLLSAVLICATATFTMAQNLLVGSSMEDESAWTFASLGNNLADTITWNYTLDGPDDGAGGCLYISDTVQTWESQYCIYQEVELEAFTTYSFDAAFKVNSDFFQSWSEIYISPEVPSDTADVGDAFVLIADLNAWNACAPDSGVSGTYAADGCHNGLYTPTKSGTYYLVIKTGVTSWDATIAQLKIMIDEPELVALDPEMLSGTSMEDESAWTFASLGNNLADTITWNYTDDGPDGGAGGCLYISDSVQTWESQYCIYQPVELIAGMRYQFDAAFKVNSDFFQSWSEVYISPEAPSDTADVGSAFNLIADLNAWNACAPDSGVSGTYAADGCHNGVYVPKKSGSYYLVIKTGVTSWDATIAQLRIMIDEPTLTATPLITGTSMEDESEWTFASLGNNLADTITWNYTDDGPDAGAGGCLYISDTVQTWESQYCIYQPVDLVAGITYSFDAAFKVNSDFFQSWSEVYISPEAPSDTADVGSAFNLIADLNAWNACAPDSGVSGTYAADGCHDGLYTPTKSGSYNLVIKTGVTSWDATIAQLKIMIDEPSLGFYPDTENPEVELSTDIDTATGAFDVTITFTEEVIGFTIDDIEVENGAASGFASSGNPVFTVTITPDGAGDITISIGSSVAQDNAGLNSRAAEDLVVPLGEIVSVQNTLTDNVRMYPNPATSELYIGLDNFTSQMQIEIYSMSGSLVYVNNTYYSNDAINIANMSKGIYTVKVKAGTDVVVKKLIVR